MLQVSTQPDVTELGFEPWLLDSSPCVSFPPCGRWEKLPVAFIEREQPSQCWAGCFYISSPCPWPKGHSNLCHLSPCWAPPASQEPSCRCRDGLSLP